MKPNPKELTGDNYPHTHKMSLSEWKAFAGNFKSREACKRYLIKHQHSSFTFFIGAAFSWSSTLQGTEYWGKIQERSIK